jgi:hypothetical protein
MNKETLEEAAENQWGNVHRTGVLGFIEGAKWMKERMYSEEEVKYIATRFAYECRRKHPVTNNDTVLLFEEWFKNNKNK